MTDQYQTTGGWFIHNSIPIHIREQLIREFGYVTNGEVSPLQIRSTKNLIIERGRFNSRQEGDKTQGITRTIDDVTEEEARELFIQQIKGNFISDRGTIFHHALIGSSVDFICGNNPFAKVAQYFQGEAQDGLEDLKAFVEKNKQRQEWLEENKNKLAKDFKREMYFNLIDCEGMDEEEAKELIKDQEALSKYSSAKEERNYLVQELEDAYRNLNSIKEIQKKITRMNSGELHTVANMCLDDGQYYAFYITAKLDKGKTNIEHCELSKEYMHARKLFKDNNRHADMDSYLDWRITRLKSERQKSN